MLSCFDRGYHLQISEVFSRHLRGPGQKGWMAEQNLLPGLEQKSTVHVHWCLACDASSQQRRMAYNVSPTAALGAYWPPGPLRRIQSIWEVISACYGCHNEVPQVEWHKQQMFIFSEFCRLEDWDQGTAGFASSVVSLMDLRVTTFLMCPHMPVPLYLSESLLIRTLLRLDSVQFSQSCPTLSDPMDCSMPGFPVHHQLPELIQTHVHPVGDAIQPSPPLSAPSSPLSIFPSIRGFSTESILHIQWPRYWSFSFSISPSNEYSGLISFRIDWLDLLAVQGTLKNILQHHSSKASILQRSAFFIVQLWHPYMTTGNTIALTRWTFVGKVMALFFNMLSRLVIAFLPRSKHLLISWLQSPSAVILEPQKTKSITASPSICPEVMGCHDLSFLNVEF